MKKVFFFFENPSTSYRKKKDAIMSWPLSSYNPAMFQVYVAGIALRTVWGLIAIIDWPDISAMPTVFTNELLPSLPPVTLDMKSSE